MKTSAPYFSIIIPTRNRPELLRRAIKSVVAQNFQDFELIVVDDHSDYDVEKGIIMIADDRIKLISNYGRERSAARNKGIAESSGRYVCFLDDDDEYLPDFLGGFYAFYEKTNQRKYILRTGFQRIGPIKKTKSPNFVPGHKEHVVQFFADNMCGVWSLSIPREYLEEDKFHEDFPHWQDTHLILRLLAKHPFHQLESYHYNYYIHADMGSALAMQPGVVDERLQLNIDAVNHLFKNYGKLISPYLRNGMQNSILAGKYLHFASGVATEGDKIKALTYLKKSIFTGIYAKYWRYYGYVIKELLF